MKKLDYLNKFDLIKHYDTVINEIDINTELDILDNENGDSAFFNRRRLFMINSIDNEIFRNFFFLVKHSNNVGKLIITPNYIDNEHIEILNSLIKIKCSKKQRFALLFLNKDMLQLCLIAEYFRKNCDLLDVIKWSNVKEFENLIFNFIKLKKINMCVLFMDLLELNKIEVKNINLSCCSIESIEPWYLRTIDYPYLKILDLSNNRIKELNEKCFGRLSGLEVLCLHDNYIHAIDFNCFSQLINLKKLDLKNNRLSSINFKGVSSLLYLDLSENFVNNLTESFFKNFKNLEILNLNSNELNKLDKNLFTNLENLQELHLRKNFIVELEDKCLNDLNNLKKIDLGLNKLGLVETKIFINLSKLNILKLDGNQHLVLEEGFFHSVSNLRVLITN